MKLGDIEPIDLGRLVDDHAVDLTPPTMRHRDLRLDISPAEFLKAMLSGRRTMADRPIRCEHSSPQEPVVVRSKQDVPIDPLVDSLPVTTSLTMPDHDRVSPASIACWNEITPDCRGTVRSLV